MYLNKQVMLSTSYLSQGTKKSEKESFKDSHTFKKLLVTHSFNFLTPFRTPPC